MPDLRPGVLFDVDGTLLDTNYLHVLAWWQAFEDAGHGPVPMDRIHRAIGMPSEGLVRHLLGEDDDETVEAHSGRYEPFARARQAPPAGRGPAARAPTAVWPSCWRPAGRPRTWSGCCPRSAPTRLWPGRRPRRTSSRASPSAVYADPAELLEHLDDSPLGRITP
jgi:hypothetical protein